MADDKKPDKPDWYKLEEWDVAKWADATYVNRSVEGGELAKARAFIVEKVELAESSNARLAASAADTAAAIQNAATLEDAKHQYSAFFHESFSPLMTESNGYLRQIAESADTKLEKIRKMAEYSFAAAIAQSTFGRRMTIGSLTVAMTGVIVAIVAIAAAILIAQ